MHSTHFAIYQTAQIREMEQLAAQHFGLSGDKLMQRAGKAAFYYLLARWPEAKKIAVFCGSGNNGGDGYVLANCAAKHGLAVTIWQMGNREKGNQEAAHARETCLKSAIPICSFTGKENITTADVIVDAICGTGVQHVLREEVQVAIQKIQEAAVPIFSLDVPSGIQADTGVVLGSAVKATATMTFMGLKLGLLTGSGMDYTGDLIVNDLQLPADIFSNAPPAAEKIDLSAYLSFLKPRPRNWHKGLSGRVLLIGGDIGYAGAMSMAAMAALRIGAGVATVATRPEHAALISMTCPEIMSHGIENEAALKPLLEKADVLVLGPGLRSSPWAKALWHTVCQQPQPMVLDADGLNLLSTHPIKKEQWVLTPHPGEAARLLHSTAAAIQDDRLQAVRAIHERYGGVCVLKGAGSLVFANEGLPGLCDKGNPGMATAGMGDILSGVIAGLIAQGIPLADAAKLGVLLHAEAGDLAARAGERGMIATDLLSYLRRVVNG